MGVATGFFRPAVYAGLPNLVTDDELTEANSLFSSIENLAWMIGPVIGGAILALQGRSLAYWVNAATFVVSVAMLVRIPARSAPVRGVALTRPLARRPRRPVARRGTRASSWP